MGLDTTHDCWSGAYSAFTRWRTAIEKAAGVPQKKYEREFVAADLDWNKFTEANFLGEWEKFPDDPLIVLIVHSDCDGKIPVVHCGPLADRLEGLLPKLEEMGDGGGHVGSYVKATQRFINGLRLAAERGEDVEFH